MYTSYFSAIIAQIRHAAPALTLPDVQGEKVARRVACKRSWFWSYVYISLQWIMGSIAIDVWVFSKHFPTLFTAASDRF